MNTGGNGTHSCHFNPSLTPTHSIIPYQDIVQVVCKNEYYYSFLHKNYMQLVVQLLPFFCLLFALSTLGVAIKAQKVFPPQRKIAGSRKCKLPLCTMDIRICSMCQLPVWYYAYGMIGVANQVSDWSASNFQEDPIHSTESYCSQRRSGFSAMIKAIIVASTKRPAYACKNPQPTLHSLEGNGQFLGESLNFGEFKTRIQAGTEPIPAFSIPLVNPLIAYVIPYQDIVQVVCKNKYYYSFLHKNYAYYWFHGSG